MEIPQTDMSGIGLDMSSNQLINDFGKKKRPGRDQIKTKEMKEIIDDLNTGLPAPVDDSNGKVQDASYFDEEDN